MSDQENFLARWSRRKRDVADAEAEAAPKPLEPEAPAAADASNQPPASPEEVCATPAGPVFDPDNLPPIESITARTDIRAFLAPGVPAELARAALRRAWSTDPAIRDFVGLSENSWDFNAPGSMAGFGPLEMTEDLRRMVAQLFTPDAKTRPTGGDRPHQLPENSALLQPEKARVTGEDSVLPEDEKSGEKAKPARHSELEQAITKFDAAQNQPDTPRQSHSTVRRCHGGALPK